MKKIYCEDCVYFNNTPLFYCATTDICGYTVKGIGGEDGLVRRPINFLNWTAKSCKSCRNDEEYCGKEAKWFIKNDPPIEFT